MTENNIDKMHDTSNELLNALHVSDAISLIEKMGKVVGAYKELDQLEKIKQTYGYMTYYMAQGVTDVNRQRMHKEIIESLQSLNDAILRLSRSKSEPDYYSSQLRIANLRHYSIRNLIEQYTSALAESSLAELADNNDIAPKQRKESVLEQLFSVVYTSMNEKEDYAQLVRHINGNLADEEFNLTMVSALTLALLSYYDCAKFTALLDIYENAGSNYTVAARALVGIVLILAKYPERIQQDESIFARLSLWQDSLDTYRNLRETIRAIIATRDTDRISSKMKDEVIPELMKIRPDLLKKMGEIQNDPEAALADNPEWEEMLDKSGIAKKMRELSEMQQDGGDLMMITFSNLKQFSFFRDAINWFMPFSMGHTALSSLSDDLRNLISRLTEMNGNVCHSDMYSLALALNQMPNEQRDMVGAQFSQQIEQLHEEAKENSFKSSIPQFDIELTRYVRDLYRFFKLFRCCTEFYNPFKKPIDFISLPIIGEMMGEDEVLRLIGEFYFKREYYKEALPIFEKLKEDNKDDVALFEKIGFCHERLQEYTQALRSYLYAEDLRKPSRWLLRRLAIVSKKKGDYDKAIGYYQQALEQDPDNLSLIISAGHTELERGNITNALSHYYHAHYLDVGSVKIVRALGWLELLNKNFEKSISFYKRITDDESATASDYLNLGHALQLQHNIKEAVEAYRSSVGKDQDTFRMAYEADLATLEPLGLDKRDALILLDAILTQN